MNDGRLVSTAKSAIARILAESGETMRGLVAVDFRESTDGRPMITEINLRHVAATYAFAAAGFNLAEAHLLVTLGKGAELGDKEAMYPPQNVIFRDIDGIPIWLDTYTKLAIGEFVGRE